MIAFANGHALQDGAAIVSCISSKNNQGIDVKHHAKLLLVFTTAFTQIALAQQELSYSESRDAAIAYVGTENFIVGRIGLDCLTVLGRTETPQQFVGAWQQRNAKYIVATSKYMQKRLEEAQLAGGLQKRESILRELTAAVKSNGEGTINGWYAQSGKEAACKRVVPIIEGGGFDISPKSPMFGELESLLAWSQK